LLNRPFGIKSGAAPRWLPILLYLGHCRASQDDSGGR
jgi:hypothetical protein